MMNLLEKSTVSFNNGKNITSTYLNSIVNAKNTIVNIVNNLFCDINKKENNQKLLNLSTINKVPPNRGLFTMKIRFIEDNTININGTRFAEMGPKNFTSEEWESRPRNIPPIINGGEL